MPIYTIEVVVKVDAVSSKEADTFIKAALDGAKLAEILFIDSAVVDEEPDEEDPAFPRKLTRQERLQGMADRGVDTWEDYRGER
jgi:hypothetical protein